MRMGIDGVRGTPMKWISGLGLVATLASSAAVAQDFSAGKTPVFSSDICASTRLH
jgi:hypothetical protein